MDKTAQFKAYLLEANVTAPESYEWHAWTDRQGNACEEPLYRGESFTASENEQRAIDRMLMLPAVCAPGMCGCTKKECSAR